MLQIVDNFSWSLVRGPRSMARGRREGGQSPTNQGQRVSEHSLTHPPKKRPTAGGAVALARFRTVFRTPNEIEVL
jgi:hypothetical protein